MLLDQFLHLRGPCFPQLVKLTSEIKALLQHPAILSGWCEVQIWLIHLWTIRGYFETPDWLFFPPLGQCVPPLSKPSQCVLSEGK